MSHRPACEGRNAFVGRLADGAAAARNPARMPRAEGEGDAHPVTRGVAGAPVSDAGFSCNVGRTPRRRASAPGPRRVRPQAGTATGPAATPRTGYGAAAVEGFGAGP